MSEINNYRIKPENRTILIGDVLEKIGTIKDDCVDCVISSPPYWGLRNYGDPGQWGLEPTFQEYLKKMQVLMNEIKRVTKPTGTVWINLGDAYANSGGQIEAKSRYGIPERFYTDCIDSGWIARNHIPWVKPNHMPSCLIPETQIYIKENDSVNITTLGDLIKNGIKNKLILTPFGWRSIKNIWKVKKSKTLKFQIGTSTTTECSLEHKWVVSHDNRRINYDIIEARNLRESIHCSLDRLIFTPIGRWLEAKITEINNIKLDYDVGKFIGLIVAEGGFNSKFPQGKITINKNEEDIGDFFISVLDAKFNITRQRYYKDNYQTIQFYGESLRSFHHNFVLGKGITKSLNMNMILNTPLEFRKGIFDGLIIGDGHIDKNNRITFGSGSRQLRDDLYLLSSSIGYLSSQHESHKLDKRTNKTYHGYYLTIPRSLQKEFRKASLIKKHWYHVGTGQYNPSIYEDEIIGKTLKITKIEKLMQEKELVDIEVEGGLFIINGGIITHNSVRDRFTNTWESVFFFAKKQKYYFNLDAVREKTITEIKTPKPKSKEKISKLFEGDEVASASEGERGNQQPEGRSHFGTGGDIKKHMIEAQQKREEWMYEDIGSQGQAKSLKERSAYARKVLGLDHDACLNDPRGKNPGDVIYDKSKPYAVVERHGTIIQRTLPEQEEIRSYLSEWRKKSGITIDQIEEHFGNQAGHHWFEKEGSYPSAGDWLELKLLLKFDDKFDSQMMTEYSKPAEKQNNQSGKNPGDIFVINTSPFTGAHFATFPNQLPLRILKCACPQQVCNSCGKPRFPISEPTEEYKKLLGKSWHNHESDLEEGMSQKMDKVNAVASYKIVGWTDCHCNAGWDSGVVLDPFFGSGTVGIAAEQLGLNWIGIEIKKEYVSEIITKRLDKHKNKRMNEFI